MFRHTLVTLELRNGMALEVISKAVTHRSTETTSRIYSHLDSEDLRRELQAAGMLDGIADLI